MGEAVAVAFEVDGEGEHLEAGDGAALGFDGLAELAVLGQRGGEGVEDVGVEVVGQFGGFAGEDDGAGAVAYGVVGGGGQEPGEAVEELVVVGVAGEG